MQNQGNLQRRQRVVQVEAVVMRHSDWGEADRMLGLFTLEMGKLQAIAKGVRKARSRKAGHLEPFTHVKLLLAKGREIPIITQAEAIDMFQPLRDDLALTTYASYVVELLDRFSPEEGQNRPLFQLLKDTLARLCTNLNVAVVLRYYELRLLDLVGFRPQLFSCAVCGADIQPEDQYFSAQEGGVLCPKCGRGAPGARPVSMNALKYLRHLQRSTFQQVARLSPRAAVNQEMESLIQFYLTYLLERELNTSAFIRRVRGG